MGLLATLRVPLSWRQVAIRTGRKIAADNILGWSAELSYYFFLALFPALLFLVAVASFFPIHNLIDQILGALSRFAPGDVLTIVRDQLLQISKNNNGGLLTFGLLTTLWSASSGMSAAMSVLNRAYHVDEGRSWWRVRLTAVLLTVALALFVLVSFALVLVGPTLAEKVADWIHLGAVFTWTWKIAQWPVVVALMISGVAIVYYVAPDVQQEWVWITPGSVFATIMWLLASLGFKWYVSVFADYQKTYGAIGAVIVSLLWFYVSGLAMLAGAEMNTVLEHASPEGKDPGEKVKGEKEQRARSAPRTLVVKNPVQRSGGTADLIVGATALSVELAILIWRQVRHVRTV
jgi:membrane protein